MPKDSPAEKKRRLDVGSCVKKETSEDGGSQGDFWDRFKRSTKLNPVQVI